MARVVLQKVWGEGVPRNIGIQAYRPAGHRVTNVSEHLS